LKTPVLATVWAYTMVSVVAEVYAAETVSDVYFVIAAVVAFALSQAAAIIMFYMNMREEPGSMKLLILIPIMFLSGLLITLVASLG